MSETNLFFLRIITIGRTFYHDQCAQLIVPTLDGLMGILAHHEKAVLAVTEGEVQIQKPDGEWITAVTGIGQVQIFNNRVTMIVDTMETPEEIDEQRAIAAKERAEEQLRQQQSIWEYNVSKANLARSMERLKVKKHYDTGDLS
ncbi:MAG: ATP synthase F1 subunit epsilon [Lachnospiraceae bacterium]|nr:ATP synthase F1 subunit epsilon [Lachnospiraceae bacterium]